MTRIVSYCRIAKCAYNIDGMQRRVAPSDGESPEAAIYRAEGIAYPKFFKMDALARTGFLASELALRAAGIPAEGDKRDMGIIFMNRSSSLDDDIRYQATLRPGEFYPSPAVFVYTLANIVTGETAIRNRIFGETSFYIAERFDAERLRRTVEDMFAFDGDMRRATVGWCDFLHRSDALAMIVEKDAADGKCFDTQTIDMLYSNI